MATIRRTRYECPPCAQHCGEDATVYGLDPAPGGWGDWYCDDCCLGLGFAIVDRLSVEGRGTKWRLVNSPADLPEWVFPVGDEVRWPCSVCREAIGAGPCYVTGTDMTTFRAICPTCRPQGEVDCALCGFDKEHRRTLPEAESHLYIGYEPTATIHHLCGDCASQADEQWVFTLSWSDVNSIKFLFAIMGQPVPADIDIVEPFTEEYL